MICPSCESMLANGKKSCSCGWGSNGEKKTIDDGKCVANNCPIPGAIVVSSTPAMKIDDQITRRGICRFHFGEEMNDWPKITESVSRHRGDLTKLISLPRPASAKFFPEHLKVQPNKKAKSGNIGALLQTPPESYSEEVF